MKILSGPASRELGKTIASNLDLPLLPINFKYFYDGESYLRIDGSVKNEEIIIVQSTNPPQEKHLVELILLSSALQEMGAEKIIAVIPYLCYSRADRRDLLPEKSGLNELKENDDGERTDETAISGSGRRLRRGWGHQCGNGC